MGVSRRILVRARRRWSLFVGGLASVASAIVLVGLMLPGSGAQAIAALIRDPLAVLAERSPGQRPVGALFQSKLPREAADRWGSKGSPSERVLSALRTRPGEQFFQTTDLVPGDILGSFLPLGAEQLPGLVVPAPVSFVLPRVGSGASGTGGGIGGGGLVGGGSGGGTGTATTPPPTTIGSTPPVIAVPEPGSWLTMLVGFGLVGATLRRLRRPIGQGELALRRPA